MLPEQKQLKLSSYLSLYDIIVPKENQLRKIKELVDFNFWIVNTFLYNFYSVIFVRRYSTGVMYSKVL